MSWVGMCDDTATQPLLLVTINTLYAVSSNDYSVCLRFTLSAIYSVDRRGQNTPPSVSAQGGSFSKKS